MHERVEKLYPYVGGPLAGAICALVFWSRPLPASAREAFSSAIDLGAIAIGFLATVMTFLMSMQGNPSLDTLKREGYYKNIIRYLLEAILVAFALSALSAAAIFSTGLVHNAGLRLAGVSLWVAVVVMAALASLRVVLIIYTVLSDNVEAPPAPPRPVLEERKLISTGTDGHERRTGPGAPPKT